MLYEEELYVPENITVGSFTLSPSLVEKIDNFETLPLDAVALPAEIEHKAKLINHQIYVGNDPQAPQIGDLRISFHVVKPTTLSLVAQQMGKSLNTYKAQAGGTVELVEIGTHSAESMFDMNQSQDTRLARYWRLAGFVLLWLGFWIIFFPPLNVFFDMSPSVNKIVGIVSFSIAVGFTLFVISMAWSPHRPWLAIGVATISLTVMGGTFAFTRRLRAKVLSA